MSSKPDWDLCLNPVSSDELVELSREVFDITFDMREDEDLESRVRMACNAMMDGDGGPTFTRSHRAALVFISQLLRIRAHELAQAQPSYWRPDKE